MNLVTILSPPLETFGLTGWLWRSADPVYAYTRPWCRSSDTRVESTLLVGTNIWTWYLPVCRCMRVRQSFCCRTSPGLVCSLLAVRRLPELVWWPPIPAIFYGKWPPLPKPFAWGCCRVGVGSPALERRISKDCQVAREWDQGLAYH